MKITALIVDDEQPARDELAFLLKSFPDVEVVGQGKNGVEAVSLVRELNPHLVFLDVQMPGVDGFGVIKRLLEKKAPLPFFVFATAYDQYAVQAFEVNAIDYLLKPVAKPRLEKAILKVRRMLETSDTTSQKLDRLVQMVEQRPCPKRVSWWSKAPTGSSWSIQMRSFSPASRTASSASSRANWKGSPTSAPWRNFKPISIRKVFWRVHRSYLVNVNHIKEVVPWFKSSYQLKMEDRKQTEIPVSRAQTRKLRELLNL